MSLYDGDVEFLGRFEAQATAELFSNFRVTCPRRMGSNWQRKMWFDGTYYWRGRYCPTDDRLEFEYIAAAGLAGNSWAENTAARISGFLPGCILADFTVRGAKSGIPTTIHYSDSFDSWIAESDEASATGWAWQNITKVFDATTTDCYRRVNLAANRTTPIPRLWVIAVFRDDSEGTQWVKARRQTTGGNLVNWDPEDDISNINNTDTIYGCSVRSMGDAGPLKNDIMVVYKEGDALRSRYYDGDWDDPIEDIDTDALSGHSAFDFEHGEVAGENEGHVIYVAANSSVQWKERDAGTASTWSAAEQLHVADVTHHSVGIVEHGSAWLWVIWAERDVLEYRVHQCIPETWYPVIGADPLTFDPSTEGIIATSTAEQLQTPDRIPSGEAVPICWIGETAPATPCAVGWGILIEYSIGSLKGVFDVRQLTSTDLYASLEVKNIGSTELLGKFEAQATAELLGKFEVGQGSTELLGKFEVGQDSQDLFGKFEAQATVDLLGKVDITHSVDLLGKFDIGQGSQDLFGKFEAQATADLLGKIDVTHSVDLLGKVNVTHSVELFGKFDVGQGSQNLYCKSIIRNIAALNLPIIFWVRQPYRLWTNRRYLNGVVELTEILIGNAILEYVIEGVMQDIQSYLINAGLDYSGWTNIVLTPKLIRRATTYGTVAALYARRAKTFATRVIPTMAPVTLTAVGDEERAMNHWRDKMSQMLEFYVTSQGGDVMLTSTSDEEPVFSTEDIPPELSDFTPWYLWLMRRTQ